jgi:hypothetical protein
MQIGSVAAGGSTKGCELRNQFFKPLVRLLLRECSVQKLTSGEGMLVSLHHCYNRNVRDVTAYSSCRYFLWASLIRTSRGVLTSQACANARSAWERHDVSEPYSPNSFAWVEVQSAYQS